MPQYLSVTSACCQLTGEFLAVLSARLHTACERIAVFGEQSPETIHAYPHVWQGIETIETASADG